MIAKEGYPFILIVLAVSLLLGFFLGTGVFSLVLPFAVAAFFRDPHRTVPQGECLVLSPADGKILSVSEVEEERYLKKRLQRVCIFLSVLDVHINRIPFSGDVKMVCYHPGKFLMAFAEKTSLDNEQNGLLVEDDKKRQVLFIQIAGFIARRIVCHLKEGQKVKAGDRFGLIRFGSRMDVYLPLDCRVRVKCGDKVKGGETVLAEF